MNELATLERLSQEGRSLLLNSQQEMIYRFVSRWLHDSLSFVLGKLVVY